MKKTREQAATTINAYDHYIDLLKTNGINIYSPKMVMSFLDGIKTNRGDHISPSYLKGIISGVMHEIRQNGKGSHSSLDVYADIVKQLRKQLDDEETTHQKISGNIPKWDDIIRARDNARNEYEHMVIGLYTYIAPRRLADFVNMKISTSKEAPEDNKFNYYMTRAKAFIFNKYKTAKTYKQQIIEVPNKLAAVIDAYIYNNKLEDGDFLIDISVTHLNRLLNRLVGCSVNNLRHSFINDKYKEYNIPDSKDLETTATEMAHSMTQHLRYRKKLGI